MKTHVIKTFIPPKVLREFETFYEAADKDMERRFRDMLLEYCKAEGTTQDDYFKTLMADMYFLFNLIDACQDHKEKKGAE